MRIELGPIDSSKRSWWQVLQERKCLTNEYESCDSIHEHDDSNRESRWSLVITGHAYIQDDCDEDTDRDCEEWKDGDTEGGDTPEHTLGVRGESKVPSCAMNTTENGGKDQQGQEVPVRVISMFWTIERGNVCGVNREENRSTARQISGRSRDDEEKCADWKKRKCKDDQKRDN